MSERGGLQLDRGAGDDRRHARRHPALQRADEQVRGVQALLGRVVQLPRDPAALGLDREPLALAALVSEPPERVARVGKRGDEQSGSERWIASVSAERTCRSRARAAEERDDQEGQRRPRDEPQRATQRQGGGGQRERGSHRR